jgi:hypothetical protein
MVKTVHEFELRVSDKFLKGKNTKTLKQRAGVIAITGVANDTNSFFLL